MRGSFVTSWLLQQLLRLRASDQNKLKFKTDVDPTKLGEVILNCICRVVSGKPIKVFINLFNLLCNICMLINSINVGDLDLKLCVDVDLKID